MNSSEFATGSNTVKTLTGRESCITGVRNSPFMSLPLSISTPATFPPASCCANSV